MDRPVITRVHVLISGKVQGVWFRESTRQEAQRLGIGGWVRNLPDGRVEALFTGSATAVGQIVAWCQHGPPTADVTAVDATAQAGPQEIGFRVLR